LLSKPVTGQELFFAVSHRKPALDAYRVSCSTHDQKFCSELILPHCAEPYSKNRRSYAERAMQYRHIFGEIFIYYLLFEVVAAKRAMLTQYFSRVVKLNKNSFKYFTTFFVSRVVKLNKNSFKYFTTFFVSRVVKLNKNYFKYFATFLGLEW
jgi:hypothetical protein